jgi:hypothetical protein
MFGHIFVLFKSDLGVKQTVLWLRGLL